MYFLESSVIFCGMVAEKMHTCFFPWMQPRMKSTSSMKPMSSIVSASSRTTNLTEPKSSHLRLCGR